MINLYSRDGFPHDFLDGELRAAWVADPHGYCLRAQASRWRMVVASVVSNK